MVFGKLVVSDDFVMLRRMYYAKVHLPLQMLTSLPLSHLHILLALTHRRRLALSQVAWTGLLIGFIAQATHVGIGGTTGSWFVPPFHGTLFRLSLHKSGCGHPQKGAIVQRLQL